MVNMRQVVAFKDKVGVVSRKHKKQAPVAGIFRDARPADRKP